MSELSLNQFKIDLMQAFNEMFERRFANPKFNQNKVAVKRLYDIDLDSSVSLAEQEIQETRIVQYVPKFYYDKATFPEM
jgi:hypothetical protein